MALMSGKWVAELFPDVSVSQAVDDPFSSVHIGGNKIDYYEEDVASPKLFVKVLSNCRPYEKVEGEGGGQPADTEQKETDGQADFWSKSLKQRV